MAEQLLNRGQVEAVVEFAQGLWQANNFGVYSPFMSASNLVGLNNNAHEVTTEKLRKALASYKESAPELQSYSEFMERFDMLYARTIDAYVNTLAFDLQVVCSNAYTQADYKSKEYEDDKRRVYEWLDNFKYKDEFRRVAKEVMRKETHFTWLRETKPYGKPAKRALQIMPQNRCLLTGYFDSGLLYDLDMSYFLTPGVDIDSYAPAIKKMYMDVFGTTQKDPNYRPSAKLNKRDGVYAMYSQCSPEWGAWAWKLDYSNFTSTPYLAPYMKSALRDDELAELQYNKDIASAYAILAGEIRLFDNAKSGTKSDQFAISPKTLGAFMGKVKDGLPNQFKAVAMPTENIKTLTYTDSNPDMYSKQLENSAGIGSSMSRIIYSSDRMSQAELEAAIINDYNTIKPLYQQFNKFLEFYVNKTTKKYHFKFIFDGCAYPFERDKRFDRLMKIADKGMVLNSSAYASVIGMCPQDFDYSLSEGKYGDMQDKLSMLLNANTMKDGGSGGRPRIEGAVNDSTEASREELE